LHRGVGPLSELGDLLRRSREQLGLSLEEVEALTHIKSPYLQALEAENFDILPNRVAARGFLRNYAPVLKLDASHVLELYEASQGRSPASRLSLSRDSIQFKNISMMPRPRFSPDLLIGFLVITALVGIILYFVYRQYMSSPEMAATGFASPTAEAALLLPTPTPPPTHTPTPTATPSPLFYTGVTVELVITDQSWVQVLVDEVKAFEGVLAAGERQHWTGERQVIVRAGNAGGVEVIVNGESQGLMGERGQVADQVWEKREDGVTASPQEDVTNTPTSTPTPNP
jgi:cytoskeletal protein RodZ